jgi:hypothetical protein
VRIEHGELELHVVGDVGRQRFLSPSHSSMVTRNSMLLANAVLAAGADARADRLVLDVARAQHAVATKRPSGETRKRRASSGAAGRRAIGEIVGKETRASRQR